MNSFIDFSTECAHSCFEPLHNILSMWEDNIYETLTIGLPLTSLLSCTLLLKIKGRGLSFVLNASG